jgi:beta-N-acetylhexosaminidase
MTCKIDLIRLQLQSSPLKFLLVLFTAVLFFLPASAQKSREAWVDSVFLTLDTEEKIGQLIVTRVPSNSKEDQENLIDKIRSYRIGGVIVGKASPRNLAEMINKVQETVRVPMFFTPGDAFTVDSVITFPDLLQLSAVKSDSLKGAVRQELASQMKILGLQTITGLKIADLSNVDLVFEKKKSTPIPAFQVGNDMIIDPKNISGLIRQLKRDLRKNEPLQQQLDVAVKKILAEKYEAGLAYRKPIEMENLHLRLNSMPAKILQQQAFRKSITLVENKANVLPVQSLDNKRFASITIGKNKANDFTHTLSKYTKVDHYAVKTLDEVATIDIDIINQYDYVIIGVYRIEPATMIALKSFLEKIQPKQKVICHFGDPVQLREFPDLTTAIAAYSDNPLSERSAAQMIFGAMTFEGQLPLTINESLTEGRSLSTPLVQRFSYVLPEEAGVDSKTLEQISNIVQQAIDSAATPGCHVFVAHKGKVVMDQSFGWFTYDKKIPVTDETIYDLASITKVAATLQAVMFLQEKGKIDVNKKISVYLPELRSTNKKDITIKDALTHQSGLLPFIPMWPNTVKENILMPYYYSNTKSDQYPLQVAPELFVSPVIRDSAWHWALASKMTDRPTRTPYSYRYSDMGSMIFHHMVENIINQPMNEFLEQNFYEPLGASTLGYRPLERFSPSQVAPTEIDTIYRKQLVHGTVHDERAAMLGGVAGHAGLFGDAGDLAKLGQMLLNGGTYGGVRFFKEETVNLFTAKQYDNSRRGLGWDKPTGDWNGPTSELASARTFGHTGFTGTCIWVDPQFDLVFVFLSNRVWPDRSNKLLNANIRTRIQETVYRSIFNYCQFESAGN